MHTSLRSNRFTLAASLATLAVMLAGCATTLGGAAVPVLSSLVVSTTSSAIGSSSTPPASTSPLTPSVSDTASSVPAPNGKSSAVIETGTGNGIPSPTGDLSAELTTGKVCFVLKNGAKTCGDLAAGAAATFAVFSPKGDHLLVVAGPENAAGVYVLAASDGSALVLGPQGVQDFPAGTVPPIWDLSSAVSGIDGAAVLLLPRTAEATGPRALIQFRI